MRTAPPRYVIACAPLLLIPLLLSAWWGIYPSDHAFTLLTATRQLDPLTLLHTKQPLFVALLALFRDGTKPAATVLLNASGWSVAGLALYQLLRPARLRLLVPIVTLYLLHPAQLTDLGSGYSWIAAAALWLVVSLKAPRDWRTALCVLLLLAFWVDWSAVVLGGLLLASCGWQKRQFLPLTTLLLVAASALTGWMFWQGDRTVGIGDASAEISAILQQYSFESNLYVLAVPLLLFGLWHSRHHPLLLIWLGWSLLMLIVHLPLGLLLVAVAFLWLAAIAFNELQEWLVASPSLEINPVVPRIATIAICAIAVGAFAMSLRYRVQFQPVAQFAAEDRVLDFLERDDLPDRTLAASPRLTYLTNAQAYHHWQHDVAADIMALVQAPPDLLIMPVSHWEWQIRNGIWLQQHYQSVDGFNSAENEMHLMQRKLPTLLTLPSQPLSVRTPFGLNLASTHGTNASIDPGATLDVLLNWQATQTITPFGTVINLTHPLEGNPYAQIDTITPNNLSNAWLKQNDAVPTYYSMVVAEDIPIGAYPLSLLVREPDSLTTFPMQQGDDANLLNRVTLGYVAVPWRGTPTGEPIGATYADGIVLTQAEVAGDAVANGTLKLTLYWETEQTPRDNYTIFTHFLNEQGQYITGADGVPFNGRYPTRGWHPGDTIPSEHSLQLPADLPTGRYQIKVGLYLPSTGDRLLATDPEGNQPNDRSILIQTIASP